MTIIFDCELYSQHRLLLVGGLLRRQEVFGCIGERQNHFALAHCLSTVLPLNCFTIPTITVKNTYNNTENPRS